MKKLRILFLIIAVSPPSFDWQATAQQTQHTQELQRVESPPPFGTFYSTRNGIPYPFDPSFGQSPMYQWQPGVYVVDDSQSDSKTTMSAAGGGMMTMDSMPPPCDPCPTNAEPSESIVYSPTYTYDPTNLWLEMTRITNNQAFFVIKTPDPYGRYDFFSTTNLALTTNVGTLNKTNWVWLMRTATSQTNLVLTNLWPKEGWFQLGTMADTDYDGLPDAFESIVSHTSSTNSDSNTNGIRDGDEMGPNGLPWRLEFVRRNAAVVYATVTNATEGDGCGQFTVYLPTPAPVGGATVRYSFGGSAIEGTDFTTTPTGNALTFSAGATSAVITVCATNDSVYSDMDRYVEITLTNASFCAVDSQSAQINIVDNDSPAVRVFAFPQWVRKPSKTFGTNTAGFFFVRDGDATASATVNFTLLTGSTAVSGTDYDSVSSSITFAANVRTNYLPIILKPTTNTADRTLTLTISSISGYQIDPAAGAATITIASSTVVLPVVQVAATTVDATEQGTVPGVFTFTRSGGVTNLPLRVSYHVSGTATTGSTNSARDYVALPGYVDFAAGKTSTNVLVSPINDTEQEMVETVIVTLATGDYQVGANNAATVYIDDNEATDYSGELVRHGVHGGSYNKPLYVRVTRLGSAISAATLNWSLTYTYASNIMSNPSIGGDASGGQVYFAPHKSVANVTFSANWSSHPDSTYQALLKINNNDIIFTAASFHPQSEVVRMESLGSPATTIMEGNTTSALKFTRPFPGSRSFVAFFSAQGSAVPGTDYTAFLGTVNFPAGNGGPYYVSVQAASNPQTNGWRTGVATLDVNTSQVGDAGYDRSFFRIQDPQNTNPLLDTDIDGDGLSDGWELDNLADGFDPITGDDPYKDTDKDGLGAIEEMQLGTDPDVSDAQPSYPSEDTDDYMPLRFVLGAGGKLAFKGQYCAACHQAGLRVGSNVRLSPMTSWEHSSNVDPIIRLLRGTNYTMGLMDSPYSRVLKTSETNSTILKYTASYTAQVFNGTNLYTFVTDTNGLLGTNRAMVKEAIPRSGTLFIPDMIIAADVDRDGIVNPSNRTDRTSANGPFVFWVNDDVDWGDGNTAEDWDPSAPTNTINGANSVIDGIRDLEDFARLHFRVEGLSGNFLTNAGVQTRIYLTNLVGTPSLRLFRTAEANGGAAYLTNYTTAFDQLPKTVIGVVTNGTALTLTGTNWLSAGSNRFFLPTIFEGISTGRCVVVFAIASNTGPDVAYSRPFYLDLRKATDLYEHWTVGDSNKINYPPDKIPRRAVRASDSGTFVAPQANEELDYILFVHGWRMQPWERRAFASTAYKRLYWLGYKGRFGMFSWPTDWTNIVTILHWTVPNPNDPQNFDRSERRAYNSGLGLEGVLIDLNRTYPNRVRVMAHSMGNVVVSEALRLKGLNPNRPPVVHSFVASQAAMAAHAYDAVNPATLETDASTDTPEVYARHPITGLPYFTKMTNAVRFDTIRGTRNIWNYHNSIDFALDGWLFNQDTKPDVHWEYEKTAKEWRRKANNAEGFALLDPKFTIQMYEIYAHIAEARSKALGADGATRGQVGNAVNLNVAPFLYGDQDHEHSAQFRSVNMLRSTYWRQLLSDCGIQ